MSLMNLPEHHSGVLILEMRFHTFKSNIKTIAGLFFCSLFVNCVPLTPHTGENVTLQCPFKGIHTYWYRQQPDQSPLVILQTVRPKYQDADYYNGFGKRHSLGPDSSLIIHNVSHEDSGMYYCARRENDAQNDALVFSNGTALRINSTGPDKTDLNKGCNNTDTKNKNEDSSSFIQQHSKLWTTILLVASLVCNFALLITVIVLIRKPQALSNICFNKSEKLQESTQQQELAYAEVQAAATQNRIKKKEIHTTYAEVQFT